ncbi:prenyltransferase [Halalkaliarchaeum sp. AArc-CO]|uniref:prenyltransferase n=1 Tax=Halalkaliarchaeum sp. AArc-CO TaxID=2866381 RepID=UPI00217E72E5|nr:prenyltransferase [Halalkaliarchaeum sp. AArc-CO]
MGWDRLSYLITLSRPRFWLYLAGPVVVAVAFGATTVSELFTVETVLLAVYFLVPANVLLYGVNDVFDAEIDAVNPKKEAREARWTGDWFVLLVVIASGLLGVGLFAITPTGAWPWLAGFFLLAVGYSVPPARFKTTPFLDSLSNGLYVLPGIAAYVTVAGGQPPVAGVVGAWLWTMGMHTFSAIPDIEPDRAAGIQTTATVLGETRTFGYCGGVWLLSAVGFGLVDLRLGALLLVYPAAVLVVYRSDVDVARAYWWYPTLNTLVGTVLTLGALWRIVPLTEVIA